MSTVRVQSSQTLADKFIQFAAAGGQENKKLASEFMGNLVSRNTENPTAINGDFDTKVDQSFNANGAKQRWFFKVWRFRF